MAFGVTSLSSQPVSSTPGVTPGVCARDFISSLGDYAFNRYGQTIVNSVRDRVDKTVLNVADYISGNNSDNNGSSGRNSKSSSNSNSNSSGGDNDSPPPTSNGKKGGRRPRRNLGPGGSPNSLGIPSFSINSGIDSGVVVNPLQQTTDFYSPLYIQCGRLFSDGTSQKESDLSSLMNNQLFYQYQIIVTSEINYSLAKELTQEKFYDYVRKISYALQLYYMIDSILAYTTHSPNHNMAMTTVRASISSDVSNGHIKLKELLESTPIPPRLLEYIRYMYQNYSFYSVSGSSIIRLSLDDSLCTGEYEGGLGINNDTYFNVINSLISCSNISAILRRIRPNWQVKMPPSSYEALFDPQFSTFWHNSNIAYQDFGSKISKYTISVKGNTESIYYGIFDDRLDGVIYASCSIQDAFNIIQKGLWCPFDKFDGKISINNSLLYFDKDQLLNPANDVAFRNASMVFAAPHVVTTKDGNKIWVVDKSNFAGSCIPQLHSLDNVTQALVRTVSWLLAPV